MKNAGSWDEVEAQDVLVAVSQRHELQPPSGLRPTRVTLALVVGLLVETCILLGLPVW